MVERSSAQTSIGSCSTAEWLWVRDERREVEVAMLDGLQKTSALISAGRGLVPVLGRNYARLGWGALR